MRKRVLEVLLALCGLSVASYLTLYKLGYIGTLACGTGGCETVQLSRYATFLHVPVAAWGIGYYAAVLALAGAGLQERLEESSGLCLALVLLSGWGLLFSAWLTYLELFVIHAICRWCVISATLATLLFVIALFDFRDVQFARGFPGEAIDAGAAAKPEEITPV